MGSGAVAVKCGVTGVARVTFRYKLLIYIDKNLVTPVDNDSISEV
jgi:hypothetical protein